MSKSPSIGKAALAAVGAIVGSLATVNAVAAAPGYTFTALGIPSGYSNSDATGINDSGQITINAENPTSTSNLSTAFEYSGGNFSQLPMPAGALGSYADGINKFGVVVGSYYTGLTQNNSSLWYPYTYTGGSTTSLPAYDSQPPTDGFAINSSGTIAGTSQSAGYGGYRAFTYSSSSGFTTLGSLKSSEYRDAALAINDSGTSAGYSSTVNGHEAVVWNATGQATSLGFLPNAKFTSSAATAINSAGTVVGQSGSSSGTYDAFIYASGGTMQDLGNLGGGTYASGVNNSDVVVGYGQTSNSRGAAFAAWVDIAGTMYNLNDLTFLPTGWTLVGASAINNNGDIVGYGTNANGQMEAFMLTPTPEPAALSLMVMGGLLVGVRRRRSN